MKLFAEPQVQQETVHRDECLRKVEELKAMKHTTLPVSFRAALELIRGNGHHQRHRIVRGKQLNIALEQFKVPREACHSTTVQLY